MMEAKRQLKKFLGLTAVGILILAGISIAASVKDKDGSENKSIQTYDKSDHQIVSEVAEESGSRKICRKFFEEDEQDALARGYIEKDIVDCSFVSCGGLY